MNNKIEYILCAAIRRLEPKKCSPPYWEGTNDICNIEIGYRHHDILRRFSGKVSKSPKNQGFYTSFGRYVSREEAAKIAYNCGQIIEEKRVLYSEDLY